MKELRDKTNLSWANLSLRVKSLKEDGLLMVVGKEGKSKVVQMNKHQMQKYLDNKLTLVKTWRKELLEREFHGQ